MSCADFIVLRVNDFIKTYTTIEERNLIGGEPPRDTRTISVRRVGCELRSYWTCRTRR